ncbi:MAG: acyl-CoA thioesterase [Trebonia sp.]
MSTYGVTEAVDVHFEDLDAQGVVHNARYVLLLERAMSAYWTRNGYPWDPSSPQFMSVFFVVKEFAITYHAPITRPGPVGVQFWIDRLGTTSAVYGFRVVSPDETVTYAEGRRVQVRLDPTTLRPAVIGPELRAACAPLLARNAREHDVQPA